MALHAFIDESFEKDGVFVLGGYIASPESWAAFSKEWEKLLRRFGTLSSEQDKYHFKMKEMALTKERMSRVEPFFRIIEDHVLGWVSAKIDVAELRRAASRIWVPRLEIDWGKYMNPYFMAFRCLLDMFHIHRPKMVDAIPLTEKIDFYFDERFEKKAIIEMWENYIKARPEEVRKYYGASPKFVNDDDFLQLQAADFWVWWVRKWYVDGSPEKITTCDFGDFRLRGGRKFLRVNISFNEDQLLNMLKRTLRIQIGKEPPIYFLSEPSKS